jgi:Domain of unknown function (DUF4382)
MTRYSRLFGVSAVTLAAALVAACGGGGGGGAQSKTGALTLGITDAPVDVADAVVVQFSGVELKPMNGNAFSINFAEPKTIDLLALQGTNRATLLDGEQIPAGEYNWMRLKVNADPNVAGDSYITIGGSQCELRIPSGSETGLKLNRGFTVGVGATTDLTVDFDLRKSVVQPPGQHTSVPACDGQAFLLKPALRVVDSLQVGTITGTVDPTLITQACPAGELGNVYLFGPYTDTDPVPVPDDVDDNDADGPNPITTAMVALDGSSNAAYTIGFVPAGRYVAAYTCSADAPDVDADLADSPAGADEVVDFTPAAGVPVTVVANQSATVDFPPPGP